MAARRPLRYGVVSTFVPRECGIATYSADVIVGIQAAHPDARPSVLALSDASYTYPPLVQRELAQSDEPAYAEAADWLNASDLDAVLIQHEFGIFGGFNGRYLTTLLRRLKKPVVLSLHTVPMHPKARKLRSRLSLLRRIFGMVDAVVVKIPSAVTFFREAGFPDELLRKLTVIPHGAPTVPAGLAQTRAAIRARLGIADDAILILTYGLITKKKGIQHALRAMKHVAKRYPNATYLIAGRTHPSKTTPFYDELRSYAAKNGLADTVRFDHRYMTTDEVLERLVAADIYLVPYLSKEQVSSGTLAYAVAAGKPVVATRFAYAADTLADGRGLLVDFAAPKQIAQALEQLIADPALRVSVGRKAAAFGRQLSWKRVGGLYYDALQRAAGRR